MNFTTTWNAVKDAAVIASQNGKGPITSAWSGIKAGIKSIWDQMPSVIKNPIESAKNTLTNLWGNIKSTATSAFSNIVSSVTSIFGQLPGKIKSIGSNLISGLWNGIADKATWLWDKVKGFGNKLLSGIKGIFGISSPSKVMRYLIGRNIGVGFALGIEDEESTVENSMQKLMSPKLAAEYGAQLRSAVNDQTSSIGRAASSLASSQANNLNLSTPTASEIAQAIWAEAPELDVDLDGEKVGTIIEPRISRIQGSKTTTLNRRAGLATI